MVEFALKVTIVIFVTEIIIAPVKIFTEAAASVASTVATALQPFSTIFNTSHDLQMSINALVMTLFNSHMMSLSIVVVCSNNVSLLPKCNLSETFYRVWALRR